MNRGFHFANTIFWMVLVLAQPHPARACTITASSVNVTTNFRVEVTDGSRPIQGLRLVLMRYGHEKQVSAIYSITGTDGRAAFSNLKPGRFLLEPDHDAGISEAVIVNVSAQASAESRVALRWPSAPTLNVKSVSGVIRGPDYYPSGEQLPLSLSLIEALSQRVIAHTQSDASGRFSFTREIPTGLYFLRLNPSGLLGSSGEQIEGSIAVGVSPKATDSALDVDFGWSSCGLEYAERETLPELQAPEICGDIADIEDAPISNAELFLLNAGDRPKIIERTKSEPDARFEIQERNEGTYQLLIKSSGFQPYMRVVRIQGKKTSAACAEPIHVRMQLLP